MSPLLAARIRRILADVAARLPYWPDPDARCPAHGRRFCEPCHANPDDCADGDGSCSFYAATGMHWDTCANRVRG